MSVERPHKTWKPVCVRETEIKKVYRFPNKKQHVQTERVPLRLMHMITHADKKNKNKLAKLCNVSFAFIFPYLIGKYYYYYFFFSTFC